MCGSMVDIQSATAEIRRGKKERKKKNKLQDENIMSASATQGSHNEVTLNSAFIKHNVALKWQS